MSVPADADLAALVQAVFGEIGGGAERALARAGQGLEAVRRAERAGAGPEEFGQVAGHALGTKVEFVMAPPEEGVSVPVLVGETPSGHFAAPGAGGDIGIAAGLVLNAAAAAAARFLVSFGPAGQPDSGQVPQREAARRAADVGLGDQRGPARPGAATGDSR